MTNETSSIAEAPKRNTRKHATSPTSRLFIKVEVVLSSHQAQQVYKRMFVPLSHAVYQLSVVLRIIATPEAADQIEEIVESQLRSVLSELKSEQERLQILIDDAGLTDAPGFSNAQDLKVEVSTPQAGLFLTMIRELDKVVEMIGQLWLAGQFSNQQYTSGAYQWQRRLMRMANRIRTLSDRSMAAARRQATQKGPHNAALEKALADLDASEHGGDAVKASLEALEQQADEADSTAEDGDEDDRDREFDKQVAAAAG